MYYAHRPLFAPTIMLILATFFVVGNTFVSCNRGKQGEEAVKMDKKRKGSNLRSVNNKQHVRKGAVAVWQRWGKSRDEVSMLTVKELVSLVESLSDKRYSNEYHAKFEIAIGELASRDPEAAMNFFDPKKMRVGEPGFMFVSSILSETSPLLLQTWLKSHWQEVPSEARNNCLSTIMECLASKDPAAALEYYCQSGFDGASKMDVINSVFTKWSKSSPESSVSTAEKYFTGKYLDYAYFNIVTTLKSKDREFAIYLASKIEDNRWKIKANRSIVSPWLDLDPSAATKYLSSMSSSDLQAVLMSDINKGNGQSIVKKLANYDVGRLVNLLDDITPSSANESLFRQSVGLLTTRSPSEVSLLLDSMPEGNFKTSLVAEHYATVAQTNPQILFKNLSDLSDSSSRLAAFYAIGGSVKLKDYEQVLASLGKINDNEMAEFYAAVMPRVAADSPQKAANLLASDNSPINGSHRGEIIRVVASRLAENDINSFEKWISELPLTEQPEAVKGMAEVVARKDIQELSRKLAEMPKGDCWAAGVSVLVGHIQNTDPEMADLWRHALDSYNSTVK